MSQGLSFGPNAWQRVVEQNLESPESKKDSPSISRGQRMVKEQLVEMAHKLSPAFASAWQSDLPVVKLSANPHVPHQQRESDQHSKHTGCTAKLILNLLWFKVLSLRQKVSAFLADSLLAGTRHLRYYSGDLEANRSRMHNNVNVESQY